MLLKFNMLCIINESQQGEKMNSQEPPEECACCGRGMTIFARPSICAECEWDAKADTYHDEEDER